VWQRTEQRAEDAHSRTNLTVWTNGENKMAHAYWNDWYFGWMIIPVHRGREFQRNVNADSSGS
jgi:hypothetical protein